MPATEATEDDTLDEGPSAVAEFGVVAAWYGSRHDGDRLVWVADGEAPSGPVSDDEIDAMLGRGALEVVHASFGGARPPSRRAVELAWLSGARRATAVSAAARLLAAGRIGEAGALLPSHRQSGLDAPGAARGLAESLLGGTGVASAFDAGLSGHERAGALAALGHLIANGRPMAEDAARAEAAAYDA